MRFNIKDIKDKLPRIELIIKRIEDYIQEAKVGDKSSLAGSNIGEDVDIVLLPPQPHDTTYLKGIDEIGKLMEEGTDELMKMSRSSHESIEDFITRVIKKQVDNDTKIKLEEMLTGKEASFRTQSEIQIIMLWMQARSLSRIMDRALEAASKEEYKPYFSTYSSTETQGLYKALLSPERTIADIPISKGIRSKDSCILEWEEGEPSHEAKLLFFYCIAEYRKTKNKIIRIDMKQWKYLRQTKRETRYKEIVGEINKLYRASVFINDVPHRLITTGARKIKEGNTTYIEIGIHDTLADMLSKQKPFMYLNKAMLAIDPKHNPHSIQLLINISSHIGLNKSLSIPTKWLISETALPTEETVKQKMKRNYLQKIVQPFERDMNAMRSIFEWKYISGSGSSWKEFNDSSIEISFLDPHPELASIEAKTDGTGRQKDKKPTVPVGKTDGTGRQSNA